MGPSNALGQIQTATVSDILEMLKEEQARRSSSRMVPPGIQRDQHGVDAVEGFGADATTLSIAASKTHHERKPRKWDVLTEPRACPNVAVHGH